MKKRIVKDYDQLPEAVLTELKLKYPNGFSEHLIRFTNAQGKKVSALPFETEEIYYLVRMTEEEAIQIIEDDEDYDEFGNLNDDFGSDEGDGVIDAEEDEALDVADDIPDDDDDDEDEEDY